MAIGDDLLCHRVSAAWMIHIADWNGRMEDVDLGTLRPKVSFKYQIRRAIHCSGLDSIRVGWKRPYIYYIACAEMSNMKMLF